MSSQVASHKLEPWLDLSEALGDSVLQTITIGYDGDVFALVIDPPYDLRNDRYGYPRMWPAAGQKSLNYSVIQISDGGVRRTSINGQGREYRYAQPLPGDELLVVAPRARDTGELDNGHVFSKTGDFLRGFMLGDAIEEVETSAEGFIWTTYHEEAYGKGINGLVKWDVQGEQIYKYQEAYIYESYGLNVLPKDEIWFCYSPEELLIQLKKQHTANYWDTSVMDSELFTIWKHLVLFNDDDMFCLFELGKDHKIKEMNRFIFVNENDEPIHTIYPAMRDGAIMMLQGKRLYRSYVYELNGF